MLHSIQQVSALKQVKVFLLNKFGLQRRVVCVVIASTMNLTRGCVKQPNIHMKRSQSTSEGQESPPSPPPPLPPLSLSFIINVMR